MTNIEKALPEDVEKLTEIEIRAFIDDNKNKPPNCNLEGPPGYNSLKWNLHWIQHTYYYKITFKEVIVGGAILFDLGDCHYELGRIWIDPKHQNKKIGQDAMRMLFKLHSDVRRWTLGTPSWAIRNQHFYEKLGFVKIRETEVDPDLGWSGIEYERKL